jgi:hypothetical protein
LTATQSATTSSSTSSTTNAQGPTTTSLLQTQTTTQTTSPAVSTVTPTLTTHVALGKKRGPLRVPPQLRGHLPFTGIPIWIAALAALFLLAAGMIARRLARS